ncbi:MAG: hemolysin family protein [Candidatus Izemoplasma sp.]|nr:hemolysin family protein [Candidatus Izemoplasma sp.]
MLVFMVIFLMVSAFFSMSETIFSSVSPIRLRTYIEDGRKGSKKALWITENFDRTITTILVGNNLANIALATLSVSVFSVIFNGNETIVNVMNTVVMTIIILIFGEIIPKSFAKINADKLALLTSQILYVVIVVLKPITWIFIKIKNSILNDNREFLVSVTGNELVTIIDTMEEEGAIDQEEAQMLQSVLDLGEKRVGDIMTPRVDMVAIDIEDDTIDDVKALFFEHQFSRLPVFKESRDNIIGILHERDFFASIIQDKPLDIRKMMQRPMYVSKSMRVDTLIELLQRESLHLAVVSGEYGGTSGIVTMEDALEELVGEIYDEHDEIEEVFISPIDENTYGINADIDIEDLFEDLDIGNPPETHYASLGGWLYDVMEEIPEVDETYTLIQEIPNFDHDDDEPTYLTLKFVIKEMKERRISYVILTINEALE